ncbi:hypothetical protein KBC04_00390 [Candidatus Babeliales bacterium]|nr:hypothetical protein [Candidatus Babeliales bacterium]MBP9843450.1 hypothetical protein [Candidatus Babeliales bacterium]
MKNFKIISLSLLTAFSCNHITHSIDYNDNFFDRNSLIGENYNDDSNVVIQSSEETDVPAEQVVEPVQVQENEESPQDNTPTLYSESAQLQVNAPTENTVATENIMQPVQEQAKESVVAIEEQVTPTTEEVAVEEEVITPGAEQAPVVEEIAIREETAAPMTEEKAQEEKPAEVQVIAPAPEQAPIAQQAPIHENEIVPVVEEKTAAKEELVPVHQEEQAAHVVTPVVEQTLAPVTLEEVKVVKVYPVLDAARAGLEHVKAAAQSMIDYMYGLFASK